LNNAITIWDIQDYYWHGVDTNFVWRGPGGLRLNGGTSTGRTVRDQCSEMLDGPNVVTVLGQISCGDNDIFQTRLNGSASYVIPWADVLVSTVFQSWPGVERGLEVEYDRSEVVWMPGSEARATTPCGFGTAGTGCFGGFNNATNVDVNLLGENQLFGERVTMIDLKLAKNLRFGNQRITVGVDMYNVFNSDAVQGYVDEWVLDNPGTPEVEQNFWGQPSQLVSPRYVRLSLQYYF
jgi:hypothetical protein